MIEDDEDKLETVFPLPWYAVIICMLLLPLGGCLGSVIAPPEKEKPICFVQPLGQTEEGLIVIAQRCVTKEEFEAAQK